MARIYASVQSDNPISLQVKPESVVEKGTEVNMVLLICAACAYIAYDPVEDKDGNCAHHFCRKCVENTVDIIKVCQYTGCGEPFMMSNVSRFFQKQFDSLRIKCDKSDSTVVHEFNLT